MMRVFACSGGSHAEIGAGLMRLGDRAAARGIRLCVSMGRGTCLDGYARIPSLAEAVDHDFIRLAWEDLPGSKAADATAALEGAGRLVGLVLAKCAGRDGRPRAVAEDALAWRERLAAFKRAEMDPKMGSFVLLASSRPEGKAGDESLAADAKTLRDIVAALSPAAARSG
jgi:hypothetical protein